MKNKGVKYSNDAEILECVNSAYTDLQILIQGSFINIGKLPNQLTFDEVFALFVNYDWNDIFNRFEELENNPYLFPLGSVYQILKESFELDNNIKTITNPRENSYYKVWAGLITDKDF